MNLTYHHLISAIFHHQTEPSTEHNTSLPECSAFLSERDTDTTKPVNNVKIVACFFPLTEWESLFTFAAYHRFSGGANKLSDLLTLVDKKFW